MPNSFDNLFCDKFTLARKSVIPRAIILHIINEEIFHGLVSKRNSEMHLKNNYAFEVSHFRFKS